MTNARWGVGARRVENGRFAPGPRYYISMEPAWRAYFSSIIQFIARVCTRGFRALSPRHSNFYKTKLPDRLKLLPLAVIYFTCMSDVSESSGNARGGGWTDYWNDRAKLAERDGRFLRDPERFRKETSRASRLSILVRITNLKSPICTSNFTAPSATSSETGASLEFGSQRRRNFLSVY